PTNQRIDPSLYNRPRKGGGGMLIFVVVLLLLAIIGGGVFAVIMFTADQDKKSESSESDDDDEEPPAPDPKEQNRERFDAAVSMANEQNWTEAQKILADIMAIDPEFPGARELQTQVVDELKNQSYLDQGD